MCRYCTFSVKTKHPVLTRPISNPHNPFSTPKFWSPGQVAGGRWKPLQYMFAQTIFQDVLATCSASGQCTLVNDALDSFKGVVVGSLLNTLSAAEVTLFNRSVELPPGAGARYQWCGVGTRQVPTSKYATLGGRVPKRRLGFLKTMRGTLQECEDVCLNTHCVGFTRADGNNCWMYANVATFVTDPTVTFYLLNSSLPSAPITECTTIEESFSNDSSSHSCGPDGAACLLLLRVHGNNAPSLTDTVNVMAFVPPKRLRLWPADIQVEISPNGQRSNGADGVFARVPISLRSSVAAMYVTLTTTVAGRFSENVFLLVACQHHTHGAVLSLGDGGRRGSGSRLEHKPQGGARPNISGAGNPARNSKVRRQ